MKHAMQEDMAFIVPGVLAGQCRCGAEFSVRVGDYPGPNAARLALRKRYADHIPVEDRRQGLLVNQYPGQERVAYLPEDEATALVQWHDNAGVYEGLTPDGLWLPIVEIRLADGRVFKIDD
jgi:hypothetical protein